MITRVNFKRGFIKENFAFVYNINYIQLKFIMKKILFILLLLPTLSFSQIKVEVDTMYRKFPQDEEALLIRRLPFVDNPLGTIQRTDSTLTITTGHAFPDGEYILVDGPKSNIWFAKSKTTNKVFTFYMQKFGNRNRRMCIMYGDNWSMIYFGDLVR